MMTTRPTLPLALHQSIHWAKATNEEYATAFKIAERMKTLTPRSSITGTRMDIIACHVMGCRLDLKRLLGSDDFNFLHDVCGIAAHLNHKTGKLEDCFLPRIREKEVK